MGLTPALAEPSAESSVPLADMPLALLLPACQVARTVQQWDSSWAASSWVGRGLLLEDAFQGGILTPLRRGETW